MLQKKTVIDQIEITSSGNVQVRFGKQILEDEKILHQQWHRTSFEPGCDIDAQLKSVNNNLVSMGEAKVETSGIDRLKSLCAAAWDNE